MSVKIRNRKQLLHRVDYIIESGAGNIFSKFRIIQEPRVSIWSKLWKKLSF